ncbi:Peroxisomal membrane protein 2 [Candida viswanathii]|uniref:Peroxisomal membrane protein 2 n=1 Tax=Candida viswanathii TaxID=5486 RepID=A0A367XN33_9ASCO|nr:Peroxisomal membrane protein 2 [Candida viswanathii]
MSNLQKLNAQYIAYIIKYPLLTKSITAGVFSGLNETVSSVLTNEYKETTVAGLKIKHVFSEKLLTMVIYGSCIATPISHFMYQIINTKLFKGPLTSKGKILRILTSLSTVTPTLSACFVSWISLINNYKLPKEGFNVAAELKRIVGTVRAGLKKGYLPVLKSSLVVSSCALVVAQKFVPPELWVVFFNLVYFFLGTYQNTKLKRLQKQQRLLKKDE